MDSFDRMMQLLRTTGDRCIILNSKGEPEYVVVSFAHYQELVRKGGGQQSRPKAISNTAAPTLFALIDELQALRGALDGQAPKQGGELTEGALLDKINRDIAVWKEHQKTKEQPFQEWDSMMERLNPRGESAEKEEEEHYEPEPLE